MADEKRRKILAEIILRREHQGLTEQRDHLRAKLASLAKRRRTSIDAACLYKQTADRLYHVTVAWSNADIHLRRLRDELGRVGTQKHSAPVRLYSR